MSHRVACLQLIPVHELWDNGRLRGEEERVCRTEEQGRDIEHPQLDEIRRDQRSKQTRQHHARQVETDHQLAPGETIGQRAAHEHE